MYSILDDLNCIYFSVKNMMMSERPWAKGHEPRKGNLWIYGDSISYYFYRSVEEKLLCKKIFRKCMVTYNWLYPKTLYDLVSKHHNWHTV